jgi:hypothetical protein
LLRVDLQKWGLVLNDCNKYFHTFVYTENA